VKGPAVRPQSAAHQAFGRAIRELRDERGMSQEDLAHRCGVDRSYMGGIERGERNVSLRNIFRIADGLGVSTPELFDRYERLASKRKR
jgi:transcriptional regulator with XRE-family HTH domain